jgi:hypothetical protein
MKKVIYFGFILAAVFSTLIASAQNVGIGETNPTAMRLQVKTSDSAILMLHNSTDALAAKSSLYFRTGSNYSGGIATVNTNPATYRMGFYTYGGSLPSDLKERMTIADNGKIGINNINPTARLDVAGNIKIADGTQGNGKVLTSDVDGNASWQSQAYSNTERFMFYFGGYQSSSYNFTTWYNLGTTQATYSVTYKTITLTILRAGVYHIDLEAKTYTVSDFSPTSSTPKSMKCTIEFKLGPGAFTAQVYEARAPFLKPASSEIVNYSSYGLASRTIEMYIPANAVLIFSGDTNPPVNYYTGINVTGFLIAD